MKFNPLALAALASLALAPAAVAESYKDLVAKGRQFASQYHEEEALRSFHAAEKLAPGDPALLADISREYRHLMSDASNGADKLKFGRIALEYAERAAAAGPNDPEAQLAPAITYGKLLPLIDDKGQHVDISRRIRASADRTLKLDPNNDLAWHILGRWHRGVAQVGGMKRFVGSLVYGDLPKSTFENAAACFEKAMAIKPDRPMHCIELGRVYSEMGRAADAERLIRKGLTLPQTDKDDPETKRRGRQTLAEMK